MELRRCLERIAGGERGALRELYDATAARLFALARAILGDTPAADEVLFHVYAHVWQHARDYRDEGGTVLTWLLVVCRGQAIDRLRRASAEDSSSEETRPSAPRGAEVLELVRRDTIVRDALEKLTPVRRLIIALAFFKGLNAVEIAEECRLPVRVVRWHIRQALRGLRSELA